jgi:hypothetical protein
VALVQVLLRRCYDKTFISKLVADGLCGPKTLEAIRKFQSDFSIHSVNAGLKPLETDGIVTRADNFGFDVPGGYAAFTIVALNWTLAKFNFKSWSNLAFDPTLPPYLRVQMMKTS